MLPLVVAAVVLLVLSLWATRYVVAMPGHSHAGEFPPLDETEHELQERLRLHVRMLASEIGERNIWNPGSLEAAARYIEDSLTGLNYRVNNQEYETSGAKVRNLDADAPGTALADEIVLVGAHYDSVPGCPGANDNATGVAAVLELARLFANRKMDRTVRFVAFVNEEPPFCFTNEMGSRVYARRSRAQSEKIIAMLSLETIGYYSDVDRSQRYPFPFGLFYPRTGNFIGFVGNLSSRRLVCRCVEAFRKHARFPSEGTAAPGYLPGIFWSDHSSFWREGFAAVMVTDTAPFRYPYYHTAEDTIEKVAYDRTARVVMGLKSVVESLAQGEQ